MRKGQCTDPLAAAAVGESMGGVEGGRDDVAAEGEVRVRGLNVGEGLAASHGCGRVGRGHAAHKGLVSQAARRDADVCVREVAAGRAISAEFEGCGRPLDEIGARANAQGNSLKAQVRGRWRTRRFGVAGARYAEAVEVLVESVRLRVPRVVPAVLVIVWPCARPHFSTRIPPRVGCMQ